MIPATLITGGAGLLAAITTGGRGLHPYLPKGADLPAYTQGWLLSSLVNKLN